MRGGKDKNHEAFEEDKENVNYAAMIRRWVDHVEDEEAYEQLMVEHMGPMEYSAYVEEKLKESEEKERRAKNRDLGIDEDSMNWMFGSPQRRVKEALEEAGEEESSEDELTVTDYATH